MTGTRPTGHACLSVDMNILKCLRGDLKCLTNMNRKLVFLEAKRHFKQSSYYPSYTSAIISQLIKLNTKSIKQTKSESTEQLNTDENSKRHVKNSQVILEDSADKLAADETKMNYKRKPIFSNRKIHNGLNQTISVLRDNDSSYQFLKLQPPFSSSPEVSRIFWFKFATHTRDKLDLLEAWNLATTLSPSSEQNTSNTSDWESCVQDQFVSRLCQALPEYNYGQLADITYNLGLLNHRLDQLNLLTSLVDSNLTNRMKEKLRTDKVAEEDIDQCLKVSFIWLRRGMETHSHPVRSDNNKDSTIRAEPPVSKLKGLHNTAMLEILLSDHLFLLTPSQLVFCLFLAGVHRELPGCRADNNPGQGFPLPPNLYTKLSSALPLLTQREVGVVCHSLHQAHLYLETEHSTVRQAALNCLLEFPDSHIVRDQFTVSGVAKFMKKRGSENTRQVIAIMKKYKPHLYSLNSYTKLRLLQFILPGKPSPEDSKEFMSDLCQSMSGQMSQMRLKDLEQFTFCLFFLNHKDLSDNISAEIAQAMLLCDWADVRSGRSFVFLITHLARLGRWEVESMSQIIREANKCKMKKLHTDSGLASAIEFLFGLNIPWVREVNTTYIIKFIQRNRFLCRNSLFQVLELDCIRELHGLSNCERLNPQLRKTLTAFFHSLPEYKCYNNVSSAMTPGGKIVSTNFNDQTKSFVQRDLATILGGSDRVWCGHPFPHSTSSVLIFAQDQEGRPVQIPPRFNCYTSHSIISRVPDLDLSWTAVVVPSKGLMDWQGNQFGPVRYKLEDLATLGYRTKVVNWVEYFRALKERNNLNFLRNVLNINVKQNRK
eukprot:GFUD01032626.1.p1 GENE.GFUD01032626.1~~GFUD01032626.1.p1  ORF type:complete len:825 (+),score=217.37 GFUD01032626.1:35-2509(+)